MRLSQLARRLSVKTTEIAEILTGQGLTIEDRPNARLEPGHIKVAVLHFRPDLLDELMRTEDESANEPDAGFPLTAETSKDKEEEPVTGETFNESSELSELSAVPPEVIRAPKLELPGLRVVGKIELPEPKKRDIPDKEKLQDKSRERAQREQRTGKNPIALQREKEEREQLRKKREEEKKLKRLRTERYLQKVKEKKAAKEPRSKPTTEPPGSQPVSNRPVPKTWLGRFFRWWTTP